jgi:hypothetical protein
MDTRLVMITPRFLHFSRCALAQQHDHALMRHFVIRHAVALSFLIGHADIAVQKPRPPA